jgi:hypothetical protein
MGRGALGACKAPAPPVFSPQGGVGGGGGRGSRGTLHAFAPVRGFRLHIPAQGRCVFPTRTRSPGGVRDLTNSAAWMSHAPAAEEVRAQKSPPPARLAPLPAHTTDPTRYLANAPRRHHRARTPNPTRPQPGAEKNPQARVNRRPTTGD